MHDPHRVSGRSAHTRRKGDFHPEVEINASLYNSNITIKSTFFTFFRLDSYIHSLNISSVISIMIASTKGSNGTLVRDSPIEISNFNGTIS